jgi:hypothetical protein
LVADFGQEKPDDLNYEEILRTRRCLDLLLHFTLDDQLFTTLSPDLQDAAVQTMLQQAERRYCQPNGFRRLHMVAVVAQVVAQVSP